jgi:bacillithiol biosynthesis cysteine-adding enzyme BshC
VTTGQQPGLLTGPLYTVYKALSAAALARHLESLWNRPVVPLFWSAGDDHDFAEANHTAWPTPDGSVRQVVLRERPADAPLTPLSREPVGGEIEAVLDALAADLPASDFREATLNWLRASYQPAATLSGAYNSALAELLAPAGVVVFDSTHRAVKTAAAPLLVQAINQSSRLDRALVARRDELIAGGRDPGVAVGDDATLVMLESSQGRDRLIRRDDALATRRGNERFDIRALQEIAARSPERLSPNVLLRPVVESALLPTVAYVAGPGELRYLELTTPIYQALDVPRQVPIARWSGVLIEPRVDRVLEKLGLTLDDLLAPGHDAEDRLIRAQLPDEAVAVLQRLRTDIEQGYADLKRFAVAIDPTLARPVEGFRNQALVGSQNAERKLLQHLRRKEETALNQLTRARAAVLPGGLPQERVFTIAPFLSRYGPGLLDSLGEAIARWYDDALEATSAPA